jgi:glutamyl-tRNA synthetase
VPSPGGAGSSGAPDGGPPRVRFAPSPTGFLHVGSARAALFNWLFARHHGGTVVLRIEDTDELRNREEWVDGILTSLAWLGMVPDEGPYRQSERRGRHTEAAERLWSSGHLYACDCPPDEVRERTKGNAIPGYDGHCRERGLERGEGRALRFRVPDDGVTVVDDIIRGAVEFPNAAIEDFVVVKSTGQPLFLLANVVDDIDMDISHVIRGEDLLPSTPKGIFLWRALQGAGSKLPVYAHLPLLVNKERKKLSKRRDEVAVEAYRAQGFLPEAFVNALALLGWSPPDDTETLSMDELIAAFGLEDVNHSPAFFDVDKVRHLNGEYIRAMSVEEFVAACDPFVAGEEAPWPPDRYDPGTFRAMAPVVQERVAVLGEVPAMVDFLFLAEPVVDPAAWEAVVKDAGSGEILDKAVAAYTTGEWDSATLHATTVEVAEAVGRKLGKAQMPIRVAVTGRRVGPPLFESLEVLGRDTVLARLAMARSRLGAGS